MVNIILIYTFTDVDVVHKLLWLCSFMPTLSLMSTHLNTQTHEWFIIYNFIWTLSTRVKSYRRLISLVVIAFGLLYELAMCVRITFSNRIWCALNRRCLCLSNLSINVCLTLLFFLFAPLEFCWFFVRSCVFVSCPEPFQTSLRPNEIAMEFGFLSNASHICTNNDEYIYIDNTLTYNTNNRNQYYRTQFYWLGLIPC